jgi:hypothetical protein
MAEEKCGHVNRHFYNTEGILEDLLCDLEAGHPPVELRREKTTDAQGKVSEVSVMGARHSAEYEYKKVKVMPPLKLRVEGKAVEYEVVKQRTYWLDAAEKAAPQEEPEG